MSKQGLWSAIFNPAAYLDDPAEQALPPNAEVLLARVEALLGHRLQHGPTGDRHSVLRGGGLDLADLRPYFPGDDIRRIDWNVFARTFEPHVKSYHAERNLTTWLVVDLTPSMLADDLVELTLMLSALLGRVLQGAGHRLGLFAFSADAQVIVEPGSGRRHLAHLLARLLRLSQQTFLLAVADGYCGEARLGESLHALLRMLHGHQNILVLSDFVAASPEQWHRPLMTLSQRGELLGLLLSALPDTRTLENLGLIDVVDPEAGRVLKLDGSDTVALRRLTDALSAHEADTLARLKPLGGGIRIDARLPLETQLAAAMRGLSGRVA